MLDERDFRARAAAFRDAFAAAFAPLGGGDVFYAGKAFLCTEVARWIAADGLGLDVCTGGELAVALRAGVPGERIGLHGNNKSDAELRRALAAGVGRIVVDSLEEVDRVADLAAEARRPRRILLRVTVGVEAHTHEYIATAHEDQKFGLSITGGVAAEAVRRALAPAGAGAPRPAQPHRVADLRHRRFRGRRPPRARPARRDPRTSTASSCRSSTSAAGSASPTRASTIRRTRRTWRRAWREIVERECRSLGIAPPRISVEPGRAIAGPSTFTLYEVGAVKDVLLDHGARRRYVAVDGGMSDNIRTALYDADYSCTLASRRVVGAGRSSPASWASTARAGTSSSATSSCPADVARGDLLAVPGTGAYCRSMASQYNHVPRPPVVAVRDGEARVLVRRETEDDLLALDVG